MDRPQGLAADKRRLLLFRRVRAGSIPDDPNQRGEIGACRATGRNYLPHMENSGMLFPWLLLLRRNRVKKPPCPTPTKRHWPRVARKGASHHFGDDSKAAGL